MKLLDVFLISETKAGPILGKCVLGISLISIGSVLTVSPVSSLVILLNLHSFPIILLIPFQVFFMDSSVDLKLVNMSVQASQSNRSYFKSSSYWNARVCYFENLLG